LPQSARRSKTQARAISGRFRVWKLRLMRSTTGGLMHAVIRRYRVRLGTMEQAARYAEKWFLPLVRAFLAASGYGSCD